ncbi:MAG: ferrous iron transport protein B, partial [Thermoplasmata archaeon]
MKVVAIVGNPNVGKTELFNRLTGLNQHVGNWPGVTVEKKEGKYSYGGEEINVIDLPGIYGFTARSIDEKIAKNFIVKNRPDVVVDVIDSTNLERNLYLTLLLIESGANVVIALNMWDIAKERGVEIDVRKLEGLLGVPVVPTVATTGKGIEELKKAIFRAVKGKKKVKKIEIDYGQDVEEKIQRIEKILDRCWEGGYPSPRWVALRILEEDEDILSGFRKKDCWKDIEKLLDEKISSKIVEKRYEMCSKLAAEIIKEKKEVKTLTDIFDEIFLHKVLGIPIFMAILYAMFQFTFSFSAPFSDGISLFFSWLGNLAKSNIPNGVLASFVADGICAGLGSVLVFVPPIFCLFFALSILEDSGYLARVAFVMEKILSKFGLHGKSFIPMLVGFGCNVPGIMAARTIENESDRIITIMINPLISCSARLPVYALIAGSVFHGYTAGAAIYSMYVLGITLAVLMALLLRKLLFKGKVSPFILELPRYTKPKLSTSIIHMWNRGKWFLIKAGTFIFIVVIIIWFLSVFPWGATNGGKIIESSYIAMFGRVVEPVFRPLGWSWQAGTALFFGFLAKESVVGAIGALLGAEGEGVYNALANSNWFTPLTGFAYMAFVLIYFPCVATL